MTKGKPLSEKQETFARALSLGVSPSVAYRDAGYTASTSSTAARCAYRLRTSERVRARIQQLIAANTSSDTAPKEMDRLEFAIAALVEAQAAFLTAVASFQDARREPTQPTVALPIDSACQPPGPEEGEPMCSMLTACCIVPGNDKAGDVAGDEFDLGSTQRNCNATSAQERSSLLQPCEIDIPLRRIEIFERTGLWAPDWGPMPPPGRKGRTR